ncbi:ATPase [Candidatus Gracilibacteria bacterium]|nr:ATPase [Candidatus Gracilibacteria bacterium]
MAQIGIAEYDAKKMFFVSQGEKYDGIQVKQDFGILDDLSDNTKYVIKPDMLFGKRGKLGLLGINLGRQDLVKWLKEKYDSCIEIEIDGVKGNLNNFLVEEFVPHDQEYYISFSSHRDYDRISFGECGGMNIEQNWERVMHIDLATGETFNKSHIEVFGKLDNKVSDIIFKLWEYYIEYGFVYLEVNPFCFHQETGKLVLLDMVAKVDDQEHFKQKMNWKDLEFPPTFGFHEQKSEIYIRKLDEGTGASLKFKILNPKAKIWTLTSGGGGSLVITDTLGSLGFADEIGNYGELSGDPDFENTYEYTKTLLGQMLQSKKAQYLVIGGAIANFTNIAVGFKGIVSAFEEVKKDFVNRGIKVLVRRGGINEHAGLQYLEFQCRDMGIDIIVTGSDRYMTDILKEIKL